MPKLTNSLNGLTVSASDRVAAELGKGSTGWAAEKPKAKSSKSKQAAEQPDDSAK